MREKDLQRLVLDWLTAKKIFHWRANTGASVFEHKGKKRFVRFGKKGVSDIIGIFKGKMFCCEIKGPKGKLSQEQIDFLREVRDNGGIGVVAYSLEDLTDKLQ